MYGSTEVFTNNSRGEIIMREIYKSKEVQTGGHTYVKLVRAGGMVIAISDDTVATFLREQDFWDTLNGDVKVNRVIGLC